MEEKIKLEAIEKILNTSGGFFLITYDVCGISNETECIGDNVAANQAKVLSDLISKARMEYINWRSKEIEKAASV